jgi:hypothetical protein
MTHVHRVLMAAAVFAGCLTSVAASAQEFDKTFLDYDGKPTVTVLPNGRGTDIIYIAPGAFSQLAEYRAAVVDLPEVLISAKSEYKGAAPMDLYSISEFLHQDVVEAIIYGGYYVVDRPGAGVLYMTLAITDLKLKKKKRGLLAYTPGGYFMKSGIDATRSMMEKYDIMGLTFQAEIMDSSTNEVLASLVALRGNNGQRMEFADFDADVRSFASRLLCRLDNSRGPEDQDVDCRKQAARHAAEHQSRAPR